MTDRRFEEPEQPFEEVGRSLRARLERERGLAQFNQWLQAERAKAEITINDPQLRAHQLAQAGLLDQAIAQYREAIAANPFDGYLHYRLALLLERVGADDEALAAYAEAAEYGCDRSLPLVCFGLGLPGARPV